jgi:hypothetical protein
METAKESPIDVLKQGSSLAQLRIFGGLTVLATDPGAFPTTGTPEKILALRSG